MIIDGYGRPTKAYGHALRVVPSLIAQMPIHIGRVP